MLSARVIVVTAALLVTGQANAQTTWKNVVTGGGGGFISGIVFNTKQKGVAYARTDIGGAYRLDPATDKWIPLLDFTDNAHWGYGGVESIATDPVDPKIVYIETGIYSNSWDPNNATILKSADQGATFTAIPLPFKAGGNMPGRGVGERLAIDPNNNKVLYLGARSGNGLWRSKDAGLTWARTSLTATGTFVPDASDTSGYNSDPIGVGWIVFDTNSAKSSAGTSRIFVGVQSVGSPSIWVSNDTGATWTAVAGQTTTYLPHHGVLSPAEKSLYITYVNTAGPFDGTAGSIAKYNITSGAWTNVTPALAISDNYYGFGGLAIDPQKPGTVMAASLNQYYPDAQIWRSIDGGANWSNLYTFDFPPPNYALKIYPNYKWDNTVAPWIPTYSTDPQKIGWGIEAFAINPFDSNHFLYGTGLTLYGSKNLLQWDAVHNITLACLSNGIEETAVLGLVSPPQGAHLVTAVGDIGGWVHSNLDAPPAALHSPNFGTNNDIDYAGNKPLSIVRTGSGTGQLAVTTDGGSTWSNYANAGSSLSAGKVTYSANATSIIWTTSSTYYAKNGGSFAASSGLPSGTSVVEADKTNDSYVYASNGGKVYVSSDGGATFTYVNLLGSSTASNGIAVNTLGKAGEAYFSSDKGIWRTTDYGKSIVGLSGITQAWSIAVGTPATAGGTPVVYAAGVFNGVNGVYRTENLGQAWIQMDTAKNRFGLTSDIRLAADPRVYKRLFATGGGRGVFYSS